MTDLESRLRDAYRAAADTIDPVTVPSLAMSAESRGASPRRMRFLRPLAPLAAAAAVAVVAILTTLPVGTSPRHHVQAVIQPRATAKPRVNAAASPPPFILVDLGSSLKVYDTRTGVGVAALKAPAGQQFQEVASGGTARTFLAATGLSGSACHAYFYRFELSATGQPSPLTFLRSVPGSQPTAIAAPPGGGSYAYSTTHCVTPVPTGAIGISGPTGNHTWAYDMADDYAFSLAATADGRTLALSVPSEPGDLLLNTSSRAPAVSGASRILRSAPISTTLAISPDGGTIYTCETGTLAAYSTATGARIRVLHQWPASTQDFTCQVSADPTGRFLLVAAAPEFSRPYTLIGFDLRTGASVTLPFHPALLFRGTQVAW